MVNEAWLGPQDMLNDAVRLHQAGKLEQAALLYRRVLSAAPDNADALHLLGMVLVQQGQAQPAVDLIRKAIARRGDVAQYHFHLALALQNLHDLDGAVASYRAALALTPDDPKVLNNMGNALSALGKTAEALQAFRRLLQLQPGNAMAHSNLGNVQRGAGLRDDAAASFRKALALEPGLAAALVSLGEMRWESGDLQEAETLYARASVARPQDNLILDNHAALLLARGKLTEAMTVIRRSLAVQETPRARKLFADAARRAGGHGHGGDMRGLMARALTEAWDRPGALGHAAAATIRAHPAIGPMVGRADMAWPQRLSLAQLLGDDGFAPLADDALLRALLVSAPNTDIPLERFLTLLRGAMMQELPQINADAGAQEVAAALAQQCFINEYVFLPDASEMAAATTARDEIETGRDITPLQLLLVAAYFPLHTLATADALLARPWPQTVADVLAQQLREPLEEARLRADIPRLTGIEDTVSLLVQGQYEENPYPRWVKEPPVTPDSIANFLGAKFPHRFEPQQRPLQDILIAGCGTGQCSIAMAQRFGDQHMLAVDLSLSSLGYARRKAEELGLKIAHGQADILALGALERQFDLIESLGVLHHMADPWAGWRALLPLLRPGGVMFLAFYSQRARRQINQARARIAAQGLGTTADDIRAFRQQLIQERDPHLLGPILESQDFFSLSACRDLLFHVQEHQLALPQIARLLDDQQLSFLGFELDEAVLAAYRQRFAQDPTASDLRCWDTFEAEHPGLFGGMYVFWIQKPGAV